MQCFRRRNVARASPPHSSMLYCSFAIRTGDVNDCRNAVFMQMTLGHHVATTPCQKGRRPKTNTYLRYKPKQRALHSITTEPTAGRPVRKRATNSFVLLTLLKGCVLSKHQLAKLSTYNLSKRFSHEIFCKNGRLTSAMSPVRTISKYLMKKA